MIIEKIKNKMFPCSEKMRMAIEENSQATQRLIKACTPKDIYGNCLAPVTFPALLEGKIVNPR